MSDDEGSKTIRKTAEERDIEEWQRVSRLVPSRPPDNEVVTKEQIAAYEARLAEERLEQERAAEDRARHAQEIAERAVLSEQRKQQVQVERERVAAEDSVPLVKERP